MSPIVIVPLVIVVLVVIGTAYQTAVIPRKKAQFPPPGQLVDVGGYRLHLNVMGNGSPTVILDSGMVSFSPHWAWVQPEVAKVTRVVAYDRAGLGWSDPGPLPRDAGSNAKELYLALERLGISGPYILVGHSYGGLTARAFAALYRDDVAGMVLVDGSHPDQWTHFPASRNGKLVAFSNRVVGTLARIGLTAPVNSQFKMLVNGLPEPQRSQIMALGSIPAGWLSSGDALAVWDSISRPLVNRAGKLGNLPLVVLGVTEQPGFAGETLTKLQTDLETLSTNSIYHIVQGASHEALISKSEYAQVVTSFILDVVEAARSGRSLKDIQTEK